MFIKRYAHTRAEATSTLIDLYFIHFIKYRLKPKYLYDKVLKIRDFYILYFVPKNKKDKISDFRDINLY